MNEHILATVIANDEAEALLRVEEFDHALAFANDLRGHSATAATAAGRTAETTAAASTAAEAAAAATIATATAATIIVAATSGGSRAEAAAVAETTAVKSATTEAVVAPKTFALVTSATTAVTFTPSIETHLFKLSCAPKIEEPQRGDDTQPAVPREKVRAHGAALTGKMASLLVIRWRGTGRPPLIQTRGEE
ncbi:MAG: hypothetical protein LH465_09790 [Sphingomonas bacterium]|nr:hypothetical protein [Sphingomonas bacterium]